MDPAPDVSQPSDGLRTDARGIGRDLAWTYVAPLLTAVGSFVLVAYIIRRVGTDEYGLFALILSFIALLTIVDFSLATSVARSTARQLTSSDESVRVDARVDVSTAHSLLLALGIVVAVVAVPIGYFMSSFAKVPTGRSTAVFACTTLSGMAAGLGLATAALPGALRGLGSFRAVACAAMVGLAARVILVVVFVADGKLVALGVAQLIAVVCERAFLAVWVRRELPWFRFRPSLPDAHTARRTWSFALPLVLLSVDAQIIASSDAIVIGSVVGASGVAIYSVGVMIPRHAVALLASGFNAVFTPFFASLSPDGQLAPMRVATRLLSYVGGIGFTLAGVFRRDLVALVLGKPDSTAESVLLLFSVTFAIDVCVLAMVLVLIARGRQRLMARVVPFELGMNLLATVVFVHLLGAAGAAVAAVVTFAIIDLVVFPLVTPGEFGIPTARLILRDGLAPAAIGATVCVLSTWVVRASLEPSLARVALGGAATSVTGLGIGIVALGDDGRGRLRCALQR